MLFILHCYGSHFSYHQRYPREFAQFRPDDDVAISREHVQTLRNAYDNSIRCIDLAEIDFGRVKYQSHPLDEVREQPVVKISVTH